MLGHEELAPNCGERIKDPRVRDLVRPELAFDHVSARGLEYSHRIKFANEVLSLYPFGGARAIDGAAVQSARQPLDSLYCGESGEELLGSQTELRMVPMGCNFGDRHEHKSALVQSRMRQNERGGVDNLIAIIEEIQVEHARCVWFAARAPKSRLDGLQHREQAARAQIGR